MFNILYSNGRRGRLHGDLGLPRGVAKEADMVVIAEALVDRSRMSQHVTYNLVLNKVDMAIHVRKDRDIPCKKRARGQWVRIEEVGGSVPPTTLR